MIPRLVRVDYRGGYTLRVAFADGIEGDVDLGNELWGEVFEPLKDLAAFRAFRLDVELNTVRWPTGADLAPEFLYERAGGQSGRASGQG